MGRKKRSDTTDETTEVPAAKRAPAPRRSRRVKPPAVEPLLAHLPIERAAATADSAPTHDLPEDPAPSDVDTLAGSTVDAPATSLDDVLVPAARDALFAAVVLFVIGRLGPSAARRATRDLREVLLLWSAGVPPGARAACVAFARSHGASLRAAPRETGALFGLFARAAALEASSPSGHRLIVTSCEMLADHLIAAFDTGRGDAGIAPTRAPTKELARALDPSRAT